MYGWQLAVGIRLNSQKTIETFYRVPIADCRKPNNAILFCLIIFVIVQTYIKIIGGYKVSTVRRVIKTVYFGYRMLDFGSVSFYLL